MAELNAPALRKQALKYAEDKGLTHNWENKEVKNCKVCWDPHRDRSTGKDPDTFGNCIACDGTGVDYYVSYGVEDGKAYAKIVQNGMSAFLDFCRDCRSEETKMKAEQMGKVAFSIPNGVRLELIAQGYPVEEWEKSDFGMRSMAKAVQRHFPYFMRTNLVI